MIDTDEKYDIVILDSGVNLEHPLLLGKEIFGFGIRSKENMSWIETDFQDTYGHGTAMYSIISREVPTARVLNIKIVDQNDGVLTCEQLVMALEYVYEHISCRIINLSMGVRSSQQRERLQDICVRLRKKNIVLVSAFDNEECISFPAAFDCVIGVETSERIKKSECYEYVKGSIVNIRAKGVQQKIPWCTPPYVLLGGNSIACAHVTAIIYRMLQYENPEVDELMNRLEANSADMACLPQRAEKVYPSRNFKIYRASLFPFNKEMHALIRFQKFLPFEIVSVHDVKYSGKVGSSCERLINAEITRKELIIQNIEKIPWGDIDTLILGHCGQLNQIMGTDVRYTLICEAISQRVNIYSYDALNHYKLLSASQRIEVYWPQLTEHDVPFGNFNKLYHIDKPVISIMGTSSSQGKFTLQNMLRQMFINNSYQVGCISTEPNGYLLGMDKVFPIGYQAVLDITEHQKIQIVNKMIYELCENNDVILAAGQANSIPFSTYALDTFPVKQNAFLMGLQSDLLILCVNPFDTIDYIHYTIQYLEGISQCRVCGLALFPMTYYSDWRGMHGAKRIMGDESVRQHCMYLEKTLMLPCYSIFDRQSIENLFNYIVGLLSMEGNCREGDMDEK